MKNLLFCNSTYRNAIVIASLALGPCIGTAYAVEDSGVPQAHSDGLSATIDDTVITTKVKSKLMGENELKKSEISVTTTNGVVTLEGSASSSQAKSQAESITKTVDGVKSVDNNLTPPHSSKTVTKSKRVISDSWITTKVKSKVLADSVSKGVDVSVKTLHGVVVLSGSLPNQDAIEHVKDIAAKVEGVKSVDISDLKVSGN
jgi:hyperosmotically inducible protein